MSIGSPLVFSSAVSLVAALRRRELRSVEVTRAFLDRIDEHDHAIRCLAYADRNEALRQAAAADQIADAGGPLGRCTAYR